MDKKIIAILRSKSLLNWPYGSGDLLVTLKFQTSLALHLQCTSGDFCHYGYLCKQLCPRSGPTKCQA